MDLIQTLKAKAEADRLKGEQELPLLAEKVAHNQATEKQIAAWLQLSGQSLDDLQTAVDRVHEIDRLKALADQFRERSLAAHRLHLENAKHRKFTFATIAELERKTNQLRALGWQVGREASESQEAHRTLAEMTGEPFRLPNLVEDFRAIDAEFVDVVAEVELPTV